MGTDGGVTELARRIAAGDRRALARAITLVESTRAADRDRAAALIAALPGTGDALRVGLSGTPGVGKSSLIERLGLMLTQAGHRVGVLAVDPSSVRSGGSILGDKTRMAQLARLPAAYIRPSPSQATLGGVARRTREAALILSAAGFDPVLIETVGVGQSETLVAEMTDVFVLLLAPGGGDELQGVKRGIMEVADLILINKADGDMQAAAERTRADYAGALGLLRRRPEDPDGYPCALCVSALTGAGLAEAWAAVTRLAAWRRAAGHLERRRRAQGEAAFARAIDAALAARFAADPRVAARLPELRAAIAAGRMTPETAAEAAVTSLLGRAGDEDPARRAAPQPDRTLPEGGPG